MRKREIRLQHMAVLRQAMEQVRSLIHMERAQCRLEAMEADSQGTLRKEARMDRLGDMAVIHTVPVPHSSRDMDLRDMVA